MSAQVDLERLADALSNYSFAYLITVNDDWRVRAVEVEPMFDGRLFDIGPIGGHTRENLSRLGTATLVWPPRDPGDYSLIVDADTETAVDADAATPVRMVPTRALLHRPLAGDEPTCASRHAYDCVVFRAPSSATA
ncbi:MAG: pyridoxamine 5'-phosphate oxidase family protein [Mycobacterium sp.]|uniref:pyridoxamine 5'-phosphate oxidase family protein n=1 Tax=Mycobacterium sp. TaxID=1785 RepID=UPI002608A947|nr:pyridoxamine 5'-phosphate oxidase family protein [Mycobacterium sp.]MDI3312892.1 pyridoxamine 5'-phosphate oxidase family protein [Mycobacterium sp.]